jgi:hypothetical protein
MEIEKLKKLQTEYRQFSSSRFPSNVRSLVVQSQSIQLPRSYPVISDESPLVAAFSAVTSLPGIADSQLRSLELAMLDVIALRIFRGAPLGIILNSYASFILSSEPDLCLRLLQCCLALLLDNVRSIPVVSAIFAIACDLLRHRSTIVVNAAVATIQELFSLLFDSAQTPADQKPVILEGNSFETTSLALSWLSLRDFASLVDEKPLSFIKVAGLPVSLVFDLWNVVVGTHSDFLSSHEFLLRIVESTMHPPLVLKRLPFLVTFVEFYSQCSLPAINALIAGLLDQQISHFLMIFLRCSLFKRPALATHLDPPVIKKLISMLNKHCDGKSSQLLDLGLVPKPLSELLAFANKQVFARTVALEFGLIFISFYGDSDPSLLQPLWPGLLTMLIKAVRLSDVPFVEVVFKAYSRMLILLFQGGIADGSGVMTRLLCSLVAKRTLQRDSPHPAETLANELFYKNTEALGFKNKRLLAYQTLLALLYSTPQVLSRFYERVFISIALFRHAKLDPSFSLKLEPDELKHLCEVLSRGTTFSISLLADIIVTNGSRFPDIWPLLATVLPNLIVDPELRLAAIDLFLRSSQIAFDEAQISVIDGALPSLDLAQRLLFEERLLSILQNDANRIEQGYAALLRAVSPSVADGDPSILSSTFQSLAIICRRHFPRLSEEDMQQCLSIVFEYVRPTQTAIPALGLLSEIISFTHKLSRFWRRILSETIVFLHDPRTEIANFAIETFFSLIHGNRDRIPEDIFDHLVVNCFVPLLMTLSSDCHERSGGPAILVAICQCACDCWENFSANPEFLSTFWRLLIEKEEQFIVHCRDASLQSDAFRFYDTALNASQIDELLRDDILASLFRLLTAFPLTIGQLLVPLIPKQKPFMTHARLKLWLSAIEAAPSGDAVRALALLFPIGRESGIEIVRTFSRLAGVPELRPVVLREIGALLTLRVPKDEAVHYVLECKEMFASPDSGDLVALVLGSDFAISESNAALYFEMFDAIGRAHEIAPGAKRKLIASLPLVTSSAQLQFIDGLRSEVELLVTVWKTFCEPDGASFDPQLSAACGFALLNHIFSHLAAPSEDRRLLVLDFIRTSHAAPRAIGANPRSFQWHVAGSISFILPLFEDHSPAVVDAAKGALRAIQLEIKGMLLHSR